jgi:hypothetical protein
MKMKKTNDWVMQEIETIDLGDKRLNKRCEKLLESFGCHPDQRIAATK